MSDAPFPPRRVRDRVTGDLGWAVDRTGYHRYRVDWDNPTPHQDLAMPRIPSMFFEWAVSGEQEGTSG